jgi:hypothetical protein
MIYAKGSELKTVVSALAGTPPVLKFCTGRAR